MRWFDSPPCARMELKLATGERLLAARLLTWRAACYERTGHPLRDIARRDVETFAAQER